MTRTYRAYNSASTASVAVPAIRPEFQLIEVTNPLGFVSQSGHFIACGTIYGRLYFANGCEPVGTFKGKVIYDSRKQTSGKSGWQSRNNGNYEIHFLCPNAAEYTRLSNLCVPSNIAINRVRTLKLLKEVTANNVVNIQSLKPAPVATPVKVECETTKVAIPLHKQAAPAVTVISKPVVETPPVIEVQATAPIVVEAPVVEVPVVAEVSPTAPANSQYAFMVKYKPSTLRTRICKRWGIIHAPITDEDMFAFTVTQLVKRNVTPQMVKSIFSRK